MTGDVYIFVPSLCNVIRELSGYDIVFKLSSRTIVCDKDSGS